MRFSAFQFFNREGYERFKGCVRSLGFWNGFRMWRLQNLAIRDPEAGLIWADRCDQLAYLQWRRNPELSKMLREWAKILRESHREHVEGLEA